MSKHNNNPVAQAIQTNPLVQEIRNLLYNDMSKSDIKEVISGWLPGLSKQEFNEAFTEAFVTL
jgi:hypothetical protein